MKTSNGCGCGAPRKENEKEKDTKKSAPKKETVAKKNKKLVADANAIVKNVEGYTTKERQEKRLEVKEAFDNVKGTTAKKSK